MDKLFRCHCSQISKIMSPSKSEGLSVTCQTFLKEWYSGDREEIRSKYLDKGNQVEQDNIDFMARVLNLGILEKNRVYYSDEYLIGTPDVTTRLADVKSPWDRKTFLDNIKGINPEHAWQMRGYMRLLDRSDSIVFYGLQNTPGTDWTDEVDYSHIPEPQRWIAYRVERDAEIEQQIIDRVILCRKWLEEYHEEVISKLGKIN